KDVEKLPLRYHQLERKLRLSFKYIEKLDVFKFVMYIHSPDELPYFDMEPIFLHKLVDQYFYYETIETVNTKEVRSETIARRNCRFPDESWENSVLPYSFSSCFTNKRIAIELELCNCTLHTSPIEYEDKYCGYEGLLCIAEEQSGVVIEILNMPTRRYVRNVTKTKLDFVVSIGGLVGLFFGASLLSLVEFIYIWFIRRF
ncbi:hypothetical protein Bhyg_17201, partial [Pseudolycoriella hygida]